MISETTLIKGGRFIVETCMHVESGEKVVILYDEDHERHAKVLSGLCFALGAFPALIDMTPYVTAGQADTGYPMTPPDHIARAIVDAEVTLIYTNLEWANRFAHVPCVKETVDADHRIASIEEGMDRWVLTDEDLATVAKRCGDLGALAKGAKNIRVTSPAGTDIRVSIEGRPALVLPPIKQNGIMISPIPLWTEVAWACVEDKTEGRIVVDGIQLGIGMPGTLPRPIEWIVKDGRAVEINGGAEAEALKKTIAGVKNVEIIGEIGVGISDKPPFGGPSEKGKLGTAHFALGDNCHAYPGGRNDCRLHLDGSVRNCTFRVDDTVVVENGEWKL